MDLIEAIENGDVEEVHRLLVEGVDPNEDDDGGTYPLYYAIDNNNVEMTRLLIEHGADVNPPLLVGTFLNITNNEEIILLLLEAGADPYVTLHGSTVVDLGILQGQYDKVRIVSEIIGVDTPGKNGNTPLMVAVKRGNPRMVKLLLDLGASPLLEHPRTGQTAFDFTNREDLHILLTEYIPELPRLREEVIQAGMRGGLTEPALGRYIGRYL
jgi:ankyrin repeat protein